MENNMTNHHSDVEKIEIKKCRNDVNYFMNNYVKVDSLENGLVNLNFVDNQQSALDHIKHNKSCTIEGKRQGGKTTLAMVCLLHTAIFNGNMTCAIASYKCSMAYSMIRNLVAVYDALPDFLQTGIVNCNRKIKLGNGTIILAFSYSVRPRGHISSYSDMIYDLMILDDLNPVHMTTAMRTRIRQTIDSGRVIATSTHKTSDYMLDDIVKMI